MIVHKPATRASAGSALTMDGYVAAVVQEGLWSSESALRRYLHWLFNGVPLAGRRILDIGGGTGLLSFYAAAHGANEVVCLEPEADGVSVGTNQHFTRLKRTLGVDRVRFVADTFQDFDADPGSFDVALLHNSINHLNERATIHLQTDVPSRQAYSNLFGSLATLLAPGGHVLIADCARTNLFPLLRIPHPISRTIEWHKHQDPEVWAGLLEAAGFCDGAISWSSYNRLGRFGWALLANRVGAFVSTGHFRLLMRLPDGDPQPWTQKALSAN